MPDNGVIEEPLQFGDGDQLFGILTKPRHTIREDAPVYVFLSAGLLHRVGPSRLHVLLARQLASDGCHSLRVDLAGNGDSRVRPGLSNQESVAADYADIRSLLNERCRGRRIVLAGLCSGADNAIRLTLTDPAIAGLVLMDPICHANAPGRGLDVRKFADPRRYLSWIRRKISQRRSPNAADAAPDIDPLSLRDMPTSRETLAAISTIARRGGHVLSVFTQYAVPYYRREGLFRDSLGLGRDDDFLTEVFWRDVEHTYKFEVHRARLIDTVAGWSRSRFAGSR